MTAFHVLTVSIVWLDKIQQTAPRVAIALSQHSTRSNTLAQLGTTWTIQTERY